MGCGELTQPGGGQPVDRTLMCESGATRGSCVRHERVGYSSRAGGSDESE
jgi:hypothetical protein